MKILLSLIALLVPFFACAGPHTVQRGETFEDIAKIYNIPTDSLLHANPGIIAYTGLTIEVPVRSLVYDLGDSYIFKVVRANENRAKGIKYYKSAYKKQRKLCDVRADKIEQVENEITELYLKSASLGYAEALYQIGRYKIHGHYDYADKYPNFHASLNEDLRAFTHGVEYLQVAAIVDHNDKALAELAIACGHEASPIRNPYLCLSILESCRPSQSKSVDKLLCYMYETGYGVSVDYLRAYLFCPDKRLVSENGGTTPRESLMEKIEKLPVNIESAKYGAGLDSKILLSIGLSHYREKTLDSEGVFWLHRAARSGNADADWILASILARGNCVEGDMGTSSEMETQLLYFARKAADLGKSEAVEYLQAYEENQRLKEEMEQQKREEAARIREEKKRQRRQMWANVVGTVMQAAAQTYVAIESSKYQNSNSYMSGNAPQMSIGDMSEDQWLAKNDLALRQMMQYSYNKTIADWTNTPMVPTDMSAVNLGTDMSPGSPLWMWSQQQEINRIDTKLTKMSCERAAFYRQQADLVTDHLMNNPLQPIDGYIDIDGNYITSEMVAAGNAMSEDEPEQKKNPYEEIRKKNREYYAQRYGYKRCNSCNGTGTCHSCNGSRFIQSTFGMGNLECPNCFIVNGKRTGLCNACQGKGVRFGLKH